MKLIQSITNCYHKLSPFGKILVLAALMLLVVIIFKHPAREGFNVNMTSDKFLFKQGTAVYDDFYAEIYDYLVFNTVKNDYEVATYPGLRRLFSKLTDEGGFCKSDFSS